MSRLICSLGLCLLFQISLHSQDLSQIQGLRLGVTPSALLNRWIGYQGKVSYTHKRFELEANVGYISGTDNGEPHSGYRVRPAVKYYLNESDDLFYYVGAGFLHRKVNIDAIGTFGRFNNSFFQEFNFDLTHTLNGFYATSGLLAPLYKDQFYVEFGIGLGRGTLTVENNNIPADAVLLVSTPIFTYDARSAGVIDYHMIYFLHFAVSYQF